MIFADVAYWQRSLIGSIAALLVALTASYLFIYLFLYKTFSFIQSRLGPMEAGPHGSLQLIADFAKMLQKELVMPARADAVTFRLAPFLAVASPLLAFVVLPMGPDLVASPLDFGLIYALAVSSLSAVAVVVAGWSSGNKYGLYGGLRAAGQLIAYELPLLLAAAGVLLQANSASLIEIVDAQANGALFGFEGLGFPFALSQAVGLMIFITAAQAESIQAPFDMPIAESELVAGYQVEYTGIRFLILFMAEILSTFTLAALAATVFLGGWWVPGLPDAGLVANVVGPVVLLIKIMAVGGAMFWIRATYPRLREDQLQRFAWKGLIPLGLVNLVVTAAMKVAF